MVVTRKEWLFLKADTQADLHSLATVVVNVVTQRISKIPLCGSRFIYSNALNRNNWFLIQVDKD